MVAIVSELSARLVKRYRAQSPNSHVLSVDLPSDVESCKGESNHSSDSGALKFATLISRIDEAIGGGILDAVVLDDVVSSFQDPVSLLKALRDRCASGAALSLSISDAALGPDKDQNAGQPDAHPPISVSRVLNWLELAGWSIVDKAPASGQLSSSNSAINPASESERQRNAPGKPEAAQSYWIVRGIKGQVTKPISIAALGMRKTAGVTDARIDHPMQALASLPSVRAVWGAGGVQIPGDWEPGVLILHRQFMDSPAFVEAIERRIARGWLVISEIDDDPSHWPQYAAANFHAFRGVHAVSVSTSPLAQIIQQWNPHVRVLPNAIPYIPDFSLSSPKKKGRVRVFFGALNREKDWSSILRRVTGTAMQLRDTAEFVVVHDRAFFDALPNVHKIFYETLPYNKYIDLLSTCDVALLPLNDTPFNRLKSDLKIIECCAAGVVPICSSTVYKSEPAHSDIAIFADTPGQWSNALAQVVRNHKKRDGLRLAGSAYVRKSRMHADQATMREALYRTLLENRSSLEFDRRARLAEISS